jgi:hypothetical protein
MILRTDTDQDHPSLHNGEPERVSFCHRLGLDYVSSSADCAPGRARAESGIEREKTSKQAHFITSHRCATSKRLRQPLSADSKLDALSC